jgi:hypothetical protein
MSNIIRDNSFKFLQRSTNKFIKYCFVIENINGVDVNFVELVHSCYKDASNKNINQNYVAFFLDEEINLEYFTQDIAEK